MLIKVFIGAVIVTIIALAAKTIYDESKFSKKEKELQEADDELKILNYDEELMKRKKRNAEKKKDLLESDGDI